MLHIPIIIEAVGSLTAAAIASGIAAAAGSFIRAYLQRRPRKVEVRLSTGKTIILELDEKISKTKASELVAAAVQSAQKGDDDELKRTIEASHNASQEARRAVR